MKKILLSAALATIAFSGMAEVLDFVSTLPAPGEVEKFGNLIVNNRAVPMPNKECKEPARLYLDEKLLDEIYPGDSRLNHTVMLGDLQFDLGFNKKAYYTPGVYKVEIPENFVTYNDGADWNAAASYEFVIYKPIPVVIEPAPGYMTEMPRDIKLTFVGVEEVINLERKPDGQGVYAIRFDNPGGFCYPEVKIEGNVVYMHFGADQQSDGSTTPDDGNLQPWTEIGEYTLSLYEDDLQFVMPDGIRRNNYRTFYRWYIPKVAAPVLDPAPGKVSTLETVTVTLQGDDYFSMWEATPSVFSVDETGAEVARVSQTNRFPDGVIGSKKLQTLEFKLVSPVTTPGNYIFKIRKASFWAIPSGWNDCPYTYSYEVTGDTTGVEAVETPAETAADVYTASGILVGRALTPEQVDALPAGLYIVGGKKIIK